MSFLLLVLLLLLGPCSGRPIFDPLLHPTASEYDYRSGIPNAVQKSSSKVEMFSTPTMPSEAESLSNFVFGFRSERSLKCIALNQIATLEAVECNNSDYMVLAFNSSHDADTFMNQNQLSQGQSILLNGDAAWGCNNNVIMKNITNFIVNNEKVNAFYHPEANNTIISPLQCFNRLSLNMLMEETKASRSSYEQRVRDYIKQNAPIADKRVVQGRRLLVATPTMNPLASDVYLPNSFVDNIQWSKNLYDSSFTVTFSLMRRSPLNVFGDDTIETFDLPFTSVPAIFKYPLPFNAIPHEEPYYIVLSVDCGVFCSASSVQSTYFWIPLSASKSWNYNGVSAIDKSIPIYHFDCPSNCLNGQNMNNLVENYVCKLCVNNVALTADVKCTNCYSVFNYSLTQFQIELSTSSLTFSLRTNASFLASLELTSTIAFSGIMQGSSNLLSGVSVFGRSFSIDGITFDLGVLLDMDLKSSISLNATGTLVTSAKYLVNMGAMLNVALPSKTVTRSTGCSVVAIQPLTTTGGLLANILLDVALVPTLNASILGLASVAILTEAYAQMNLKFSYPAFPSALSPFNFNPSSPSLYRFESVCSQPHYIRYGLAIGTRNSQLIATVNVKIDTLVYTFLYYRQFIYPSPFEVGPVQLLSGCLFGQTTVSQTLTLNFTNILNTVDKYVQYQLIADLAKAMNTPATRFFLRQIVTATTLIIDILPPLNVAESNALTLWNSVNAQLNILSSAIYQGAITANLIKPIQISSTYSSTGVSRFSSLVSSTRSSTASSISVSVIPSFTIQTLTSSSAASPITLSSTATSAILSSTGFDSQSSSISSTGLQTVDSKTTITLLVSSSLSSITTTAIQNSIANGLGISNARINVIQASNGAIVFEISPASTANEAKSSDLSNTVVSTYQTPTSTFSQSMQTLGVQVTSASATTNTPQQDNSSSSSSLPIIPIAAGAGGGVAAIILGYFLWRHFHVGKSKINPGTNPLETSSLNP